ncbi:Bromodomain [Penicillium digitatum]|uniref:Bromodomain n=1 Tax=Penicillium digitatum TaxID=36651 RepID=A0A7T6XQE9_PENDI|nr:Bromodomain [Penicillium digitatum]
MASKRRAAAAASPDMKFRRTKRRKVSDDDLMITEESSRASSHLDSEPPEKADQTPESQAESESDFEGHNLQTAQDKIMSELTRLKDSDGHQVSYPFIGKPDRNLYRDYYEIIQHPVSLRSIQKRVRGTDSRKNLSKTTAYPTWQSFEEEVSYVWRNAREYNEDDSDISILAGVLEDHFHRRVAKAKKLVPNPLESSDTLSKNDGHPSDVTLKNESQGHTKYFPEAGLAGQEISRSPRNWSLREQLGSPRSSTSTTTSGSEQHQNSFMGVQGLLSSMKNTTTMAVSASQKSSNTSSDASLDVSQHSSSGSGHAPCQPHFGSSPMDSLLRQSGQDPRMALIRNVRILTHASLSLQPDFCLDIPPSSLVSQQNITVHLPPSHNVVTVRPRLVASTSQRQVKIVTLMGPATGVPKSDPPGSDVDYERVTLFFNLLR